MSKRRRDERIAYGASCTWWNSIDKVGKTEGPISLPCCPFCRKMLFEMPHDEAWWTQVDRYNFDHPGYRSQVEWGRGKCYLSYAALAEMYERCKPLITLKADIDGLRARAWEVKLEAREEDAVLDMWVVEAPWAHPVWTSYVVSVMHLRPIAGMPDPIIHLQGATHEFHLFALDPAVDREKVITDLESFKGGQAPWLEPINYAVQWKLRSDDLARATAVNAVGAVCMGELNPDTDYREMWESRYGNNMRRGRPQVH